MKERAVLIGIDTGKPGQIDTNESMKELVLLASTAGAEVVSSQIQHRSAVSAGTYIGRGKLEEISTFCRKMLSATVITDFELSPAQQRNIEDITGCKVIDRTRLILDIFARRAHSKEGQLQVELAQLEYMLPRLAGKGTALEQQRLQPGVIGVRGPGEKKLEMDRRRIRDRINMLKKEIEKVKLQRSERRKRRKSGINPPPMVAIVGYTNAGKSTLLNRLSGSEVFVEDKLFATLDPTIRKVRVEGKKHILFTDTVGFINKLPHQVIAAFRATLEEASEADLIIHLIDIANPMFKEQKTVVEDVLKEIGLSEKPVMEVFNKEDLLTTGERKRFKSRHRHALFISSLKGTGVPDFLAQVKSFFEKDHRTIEFMVPFDRQDVINHIYKNGNVLKSLELDGYTSLLVCMEEKKAAYLKEYIRNKRQEAER